MNQKITLRKPWDRTSKNESSERHQHGWNPDDKYRRDREIRRRPAAVVLNDIESVSLHNIIYILSVKTIHTSRQKGEKKRTKRHKDQRESDAHAKFKVLSFSLIRNVPSRNAHGWNLLEVHTNAKTGSWKSKVCSNNEFCSCDAMSEMYCGRTLNKRTDVTPDKEDNMDITSPYNSVYTWNHIHGEKPAYDAEGCNISSPPMPWQREYKGEGGKKGDRRKLGMHGKVSGESNRWDE